MTKSWRDTASLYQIYPRSFQDLSGDGVGDLNGITFRLDYLQQLGVDAIWLSPFFTSPMTDFGYDVADYQAVDPTFGTLGDFRMLLDEAHARNIKVMIDLVPCHTSDQHPWFQEARQSPHNPKRDYYVWRDPVHGGPPNNWRSVAGGSSWTFDPVSKQYYLHSFLPTQPDLNWDNPAVRQEMKRVVRFWFDMGVDGMRVDAVWGISKDPELQNDPRNEGFTGDGDNYGAYIHNRCKYGPHFQEYLRELASVCDEYDDVRMVFEFYPDEQLGDIWQQYREVAQTHPRASAFFMEHRQGEWHAEHTVQHIEQYLAAAAGRTPWFCVGNHDQPRIMSRLGPDRARALQFLNLLCPGVSVVYYGDEIGMENGDLSEQHIHGISTGQAAAEDVRHRARTPMQWTAARYGGFTNVQPWLPVHTNRRTVNVVAQQSDKTSLLAMHRRLLHLRQSWPLLRHGSMERYDTGNGFVAGFWRRLEHERACVLVNFADAEQTVQLPPNGALIDATSDAVQLAATTLRLPGYGGVLVRWE